MYCTNCGTQNNDQAKYCIKCGQQLGDAIVVGKPPHQAKKKPWHLFAVLISLALVIAVTTATAFDLWPWSTKTGKKTSDIRTEQVDGDRPVQDKDDTSDTVGVAIQEQTEPEPEPEPKSEPVEPEEPETKPVPEAETYAKPATWHSSLKSHDLHVNASLSFRDGVIWNFSNCTAVGAGTESGVITETEADYGFILSVIDSDSVRITPYANAEPYIYHVSLYAEMESGDLACDEAYEQYILQGYERCSDGFGYVCVTFSNGVTLQAGVLKEDGVLYAVNVADKDNTAERVIGSRLKLEELMTEHNVQISDLLGTDPIYYPIVPGNSREHTDTQYWVDLSFEITEPDWTDAHKAMTFYNYIIENLSYDHWIVSQGATSRAFFYEDYTGTYFTSRTYTGVCEDFSQIFAIMCRAQDIPAVVIENKAHAMSVCYIEDYGRWLVVDTTADVMYGLHNEDTSQKVREHPSRYAHLNRLTDPAFNTLSIGNKNDMKLHNIPTLMD